MVHASTGRREALSGGRRDIRNVCLFEPGPSFPTPFLQYRVPRLGLILLGTILRRAGYRVEVFLSDDYPAFAGAVKHADVVGVSAITATAHEAYRACDMARAAGAVTILGGPHPTFLPAEAAQHADVVVRGEAESVILSVIRAIDGDPDAAEALPSSTPTPIAVVGSHERCDLDRVPTPDFSLVHGGDIEAYPVQTSRGCDKHCTFCSVRKMFGNGIRERSIRRIRDDIAPLRGKPLFICDDNFGANCTRDRGVLEMLVRSDLVPARWSTQVCTDVAGHPELLSLMRETNAHFLCVGFESSSASQLAAYRKEQDLDRMWRSADVLHSWGFKIHGMFILGGDEETADDVERTLGFAEKAALESAQFLALTPLPGTELAARLEEEGRVLTHDWRYYDGQHVVFRPRLMSVDDLASALVEARRRIPACPRDSVRGPNTAVSQSRERTVGPRELGTGALGRGGPL